MKIKKSDFYEKFGIEYKKGYIVTPLFGFRRPMLVKGNAKIGQALYHFSMLPTNRLYNLTIDDDPVSVLGTCNCFCDGCYATKGNYNFKTTIKALAIRTALARYDLDFVERAINAQIQADNIKFIRVHASGDFFSRDYIDMWKRIAKANPAVTMWTYTKNADAENAFYDIPNFNIVHSLIPNIGKNYGPCEYILSTYETLSSLGIPVYICKCGIDKNQHCSNCKVCSTYKYVLFIEHSTGYRAENDPLFPVLKALIESQENV